MCACKLDQKCAVKDEVDTNGQAVEESTRCSPGGQEIDSENN